MIKKEGDDKLLGLMVVYVDDFLIAAARGEPRDELKKALNKIWDMCEEKLWTEGSPLRFLALSLNAIKLGSKYIRLHSST